jgi:hypothetical protein
LIYEYLVEKLALEILEVRDYKSKSIRTPHQQRLMGAMKLNKDPKARASLKQAFIDTLRKTPKPTVAEAYLSKYSYRTPKETMASRVTVDPKTGEEKSAKTFTAKMDANADLTKLEGLKTRVKETGKPHEVTFIGKKGPQLKPEKHREVEHKLEVRMHMGEPHVFHKGIKVQLRATGNGVHIVAPGEKNDRIVAHTGMLSSPHFGGVASRKAVRAGRSVEQRTQKQAEKRKKVARRVAKKRKMTDTTREKAKAVEGKAKKLTPPPAAPAQQAAPQQSSRIADIINRYRVPEYTGKEDPGAIGRLRKAGVIR